MNSSIYASRRELLLGLLAALLVFLAAVGFAAVQLYRARPLQSVSCTVTSVERSFSRAEDGSTSRAYFVYYSGLSTGRFRTIFPFLYSEGKSVNILRCADDPGRKVDHFVLEIAVCAGIFSLIFMFVCIKSLLYKR